MIEVKINYIPVLLRENKYDSIALSKETSLRFLIILTEVFVFTSASKQII